MFIRELMEITEEQYFAQVCWHCEDDGLHLGTEFLPLEGDVGGFLVGGHEGEKLVGVVIAGIDGGLKGGDGTAGEGSEEVAGLIGGDGEEPGLEPAVDVELVGGLMNLEERLLEDVLGGGAVAEEADEEVVELALVALDEQGEGVAIALAVLEEELLVGARVEVDRGAVGRGTWRGVWIALGVVADALAGELCRSGGGEILFAV